MVHPPTPRSLEALIKWSNETTRIVHSHTASAQNSYSQVQVIRRSIHVALMNLLHHASSIHRGTDAFNDLAGKELERMQDLIEGHERDLQVLGMVPVNRALLVPTSSDASRTNQANRTLDNWISPKRLQAVADSCTGVYNEMREKVSELEGEITRLNEQTNFLQEDAEPGASQFAIDSLEECLQASARAEELANFIEDQCSPDSNGWPVADKLDNATVEQLAAGAEELLLLDEVARECVRRLTAELNEARFRGLDILNRISLLQSQYADFGSALAAVDSDLHSTKMDGFKHLQRLKNMLWAYGATIIEIVRRREFAEHFLDKSQALAELMAQHSAKDKEKRAAHKRDLAGLLPFEIDGMNGQPPSLEITTSRTSASEVAAKLSRDDIEALLKLLDEVEQQLEKRDYKGQERTGGIAGALARGGKCKGTAEVKASLQKLLLELDQVEATFQALVDRHLLNSGPEPSTDDSSEADAAPLNGHGERRASTRRRADALRRKYEAEKEALEQRHEQQIREHERAKQEAEDQLARERQDFSLRQAELDQAQLEIRNLKADGETAEARRLNLVDEVTSLRKELEQSRRAEAETRREAEEDTERIHELEMHLSDVQAELEDARAAQHDATSRIEGLLSQGSSAEKEVHVAQERITELTDQLSQARQDAHQAKESAMEAEATKDKLMRNYRAEADGDRAILEEKLKTLESELAISVERMERATREASFLRQELQVKQDALEVVRGQLASADESHERMIKETELSKEMAADAELTKLALERIHADLMAQSRMWATQMLRLQQTVKNMPVMSSRSAASAEARLASTQMVLTSSEELEKQGALEAFHQDDLQTNGEELLKVLRLVNPKDIHDETKTKLDTLVTLVKKWQKAYKSSNDKMTKAQESARERLAFSNFQVGDLALFLPTRDSNADKPWAAFNVDFPHHFLNTNGLLGEQIRSRQWIVARIVSMKERAVGAGEDAEKPYQLEPGAKYYLLDVQEYNGPTGPSTSSSRTRHVSSSQVHGERPAPSSRSVSMPDSRLRRAASEDQPSNAPAGNPPERASPSAYDSPPCHDVSAITSPVVPLSEKTAPSGLTRALKSPSRATSPSIPKTGEARIVPRNASDMLPLVEDAQPAFDRGRRNGGQLASVGKEIPVDNVARQHVRNALVSEGIGNPFSSSPSGAASSVPERPSPSPLRASAINLGLSSSASRRSTFLTKGKSALESSSPTSATAASIPTKAEPLTDFAAATGESYGSPRSGNSSDAISVAMKDHAGRPTTISRSASAQLSAASPRRASSFMTSTMSRMAGKRIGFAAAASSSGTTRDDAVVGSQDSERSAASDLLRRFADPSQV